MFFKHNKQIKSKSKDKIFISKDSIYNIDNYIIEQINYVNKWTISDTDKLNIIQWLLRWYPNHTLSSYTLNKMLETACDNYFN